MASRPLRVEELAQFLGFDFAVGRIPKFQQDWLLNDPVDAVLSITPSLLAIVDIDGSSVIQFSHFSVKEFLMSTRLACASDIILCRYHISLTHAHILTAQACLGMLLYLDKDITRDDLEKFPLVEYAAEHWVDHARFEDVSGTVEVGMRRLFDPTKHHFAVWVWIHDLEDRYWRREKRGGRPSEPRGTPLHYAALCGLDAIAKFLVIERSQDLDSRGFRHRSTALHLASRSGRAEISRVLLDNGADAEIRDDDMSSPLHLASREGHVEVVRILLARGVDAAAKDEFNFTPQFLAFQGGHMEVIRVFLEFGMDLVAEDVNEWPLLQRALFEGDIERVDALQDYGLDLMAEIAETDNGPLRAASLGGHAAAVRLLLDYGVDVTTKGDDGLTTLHVASLGGHVEVVRILLEHGLDATSQSEGGITPLHTASGGGM